MTTWRFTMLLIETYVGPSAIEGVGVFSAEMITKGQIIYQFEPEFDRLIAKEELPLMPISIRKFIDRYTYPHPSLKNMLVLDADNGRHMNHSLTPNTDFRDAVFGYALRDIHPGEELVCNYADFEPGFEILPSLTEMYGSAPLAASQTATTLTTH